MPMQMTAWTSMQAFSCKRWLTISSPIDKHALLAMPSNNVSQQPAVALGRDLAVLGQDIGCLPAAVCPGNMLLLHVQHGHAATAVMVLLLAIRKKVMLRFDAPTKQAGRGANVRAAGLWIFR
jgi:hypothetical protein